MERVDVVIVGGGVAGLAAAAAAAAGGVRAIVVEQVSLPRTAHLLYALTERELSTIGLPAKQAERIHGQAVFGGEPVTLGGTLPIHAIRAQALHHHLYLRAKKAGAELRDGVKAASTALDHEGWIVRVLGAEPIRAPILIVADGARSTTLQSIGLAAAQRFSPSWAEVVTFLCATWDLPPSELNKHPMPAIRETQGPVGRCEILPGRDRLTIALGPVWSGVGAPDRTWPSAASGAAIAALDRLCRELELPTKPRAVELEEWRLDALPVPPTFDGGIVIGAAAGHRPRRPLSAQGALFRAGALAGAAAAKAVLAQTWRAAELGRLLGDGYGELLAEVQAEIAHEAHGLRRARVLPDFPLSSYR